MNTQADSIDNKPLYALIPLDEFKALLGIDDREDKISRFCLVSATYTIEQYCKRRLLRKRLTDYCGYRGGHIFTLREYPVRKIISINREVSGNREQVIGNSWETIDPKTYFCLPDVGICEDIPFSVVLRPPLSKSTDKMVLKVKYMAGYSVGNVPADLASACLELAAWNMNRYRGRRIGMTGSVRGNAKDGEHFEMSMPENVKQLLEPYRRKVI